MRPLAAVIFQKNLFEGKFVVCTTVFALIIKAAIKKVKLIKENESDDNVFLGQPQATLGTLPEEMRENAASILCLQRLCQTRYV